MNKEEREALKSLRQDTGLPMIQCKSMLEKVDYDIDKALRLYRTPVNPFVGRLYAASSRGGWLGNGHNIYISSEGTPIQQEVLDDSLVQKLINDGYYRFEQPYIEEEPEEFSWEKDIPFYSKEQSEDYPQDLRCPHCNKEFYCRGFGAYAGAG